MRGCAQFIRTGEFSCSRVPSLDVRPSYSEEQCKKPNLTLLFSTNDRFVNDFVQFGCTCQKNVIVT